MVETQSSIVKAPDYILYRQTIDKDTGDITDKRLGLNCSNYQYANIQIVPNGTSNPTINILFWSEALGMFVEANPEVSRSGAGPGIGYEFSFECYGRIIFAYVVAGIGGCDIYASGFNLRHPY